MSRHCCATIAALLVAAALGGCASSRPSQGPEVAAPAMCSSALVLGGAELLAWGDPADPWSWEAGRNDAARGIAPRPGDGRDHWVEVRTYDRRWNINGRVRESSRTTTRSIIRGAHRTR